MKLPHTPYAPPHTQPSADDVLDALEFAAVYLDADGRILGTNAALEPLASHVEPGDTFHVLPGSWHAPVQHVLDGARHAEAQVVQPAGEREVALDVRATRLGAQPGAGVLVTVVDRHAHAPEQAALQHELQLLRQEVAIGREARVMLHDMANVLTRATVSASLIGEYIDESRLPQLEKVLALLEHSGTSEAAYRTAMRYLGALGRELQGELALIAKEAQNVLDGIGTVRERLHERSRNRGGPE